MPTAKPAISIPYINEVEQLPCISVLPINPVDGEMRPADKGAVWIIFFLKLLL